MPDMASPGQKSGSLNIQLLVDSIPALIHTSRPDGYLDYFNKPWLEYLGVTLDKVTGWNWTAFVHPEDVGGFWPSGEPASCPGKSSNTKLASVGRMGNTGGCTTTKFHFAMKRQHRQVVWIEPGY